MRPKNGLPIVMEYCGEIIKKYGSNRKRAVGLFRCASIKLLATQNLYQNRPEESDLGQPPHFTRTSLHKIHTDFQEYSEWIKVVWQLCDALLISYYSFNLQTVQGTVDKVLYTEQ